MSTEPLATALLLLVFGALLGVSALFTRASDRIGLPVVMVFLIIGVLAGVEGVGGIEFRDYGFAFRVGTIALALILFDGGLNTPLTALRKAAKPASVLASVGVAGTAGLVGWAAHVAGMPLREALLLGAVVSSTDAAAIFSVLRGSGINLKWRVGTTLEVESGLNDPLAVILTTLLTRNLVAPIPLLDWHLPASIVAEIAVGLAVGVGVGRGGGELLRRVRLPSAGLYPVFTLSLALVSFGAATLLHGSGFLAVYVAGVALGSGHLPYHTSLTRVHDAVAWLSQIAMFLLLGLLVVPSRLAAVAPLGLGLALFLVLVARPVVVAACLAPFAYTARDIVFVGWAGLRGAVPIVLATYPVLAGAPGARHIFDVVFFIVVVSAVLQGGTIRWVTQRLGLESTEGPRPHAVLEIESAQPLRGELLSFYVDPALGVEGESVGDLPFPPGSAATLIVRGQELIAPRGNTVLQAGDHVYVLTPPGERPFVELMFGRPEE
ncbi:MAG: potassium/proton antiporter [Gemmatimonadota bacterium]|nr:potassium/proton antiporter [Gemmatimonadota bacterium]